MCLVGAGAYEDDDEVGFADVSFCFFLPVLFGGGFYKRAIDDFEGADRVFGLTDQEIFEGFVFVEVEADEHLFHCAICSMVSINSSGRALGLPSCSYNSNFSLSLK